MNKGKFRIEYPPGSECAIVRITGDTLNCERETLSVRFPFGAVNITRATDGPGAHYWVHIEVNHEKCGFFIPGETQPGQIRDARLDQVDKNAVDAKLGDFNRPQLYHLAVRIGPKE